MRRQRQLLGREAVAWFNKGCRHRLLTVRFSAELGWIVQGSDFRLPPRPWAEMAGLAPELVDQHFAQEAHAPNLRQVKGFSPPPFPLDPGNWVELDRRFQLGCPDVAEPLIRPLSLVHHDVVRFGRLDGRKRVDRTIALDDAVS